MDTNQYYNQLAQASSSATIDKEGISQSMKTAKQKSIESLSEGFGAGFLLPSSANLLKYSGKKALQLSSKALPQTTRAITSLTEGTEGMDAKGVASTALRRATNIGRQSVSRGIQSATIKYTKLKDGVTRTSNEYRTKNIPSRNNIKAKTAQLDDPFKVKDSAIDDDIRDDFINGKISKNEMTIRQQMRNMARGGDGVASNDSNSIPARPTPAQQDALDRSNRGDFSTPAQRQAGKDASDRFNKLSPEDQASAKEGFDKIDLARDKDYSARTAVLDDIESRNLAQAPATVVRPMASLTTDSSAINTGTQAQHAQFTDRLNSLGMGGDNTDLNAPTKINPVGTNGNTLSSGADEDLGNVAKSVGKKIGGGVLDDVADTAVVAEGGLDPVADIVGLVAGLGTLFGGLASADDVKMPFTAPSINPSYQVGV